ncbi:MAG: hypothetical protein EXQ47_06850 [Bryobacterales bacterium]|nr:hypothetical protein [Bryobacterales bacterium]
MRLVVVGLLALSGTVWAAPELSDTFTSLKEAVEKKDAPKVKTLVAETIKEAQELAKEAQPTDAGGMEAWKGRQQFAKDAQSYTLYALAVTASQSTDPAVTIDLSETLMAQDPKGDTVDNVASAYLAAVGKGGAAKAIAGANKILAGRPENEDALYAVASNGLSSAPGQALTASQKLVAVMQKKAKPENMGDGDWEKRKTAMMGAGYTFAGVVQGAQNRYADSDRNLKAALPLIAGNSTMLSYAYYYLGLSNYQMGKLTSDKSKMGIGADYTAKAAATAGPMQGAAANNVQVMKREMAGGR